MAGMFSWKDAVATKERQTEKGNRYYLSPVTIWEILLTSNHQQRENLIFYCQHLFYEELVAGPSELIVEYIRKGCPLSEKQGSLASKLPIGAVWKNLVEDKRRTFVFDHQALTLKTKLLRDTSKAMAKLIMPVAVGDSTKDDQLEAVAELIRIYSMQEGFASQKPKDIIRRLALLFITYILCLEADLDSSPVTNLWETLNLHTMIDRISYVVEELEILTRRGPFIQMALMAYCQTFTIGVRPSRGLFLDCLHSIYFTYMDVFLTQDEHFRFLRDAVAPNPLYKKKIYLFDELQINTEERYVPEPEVH